MELLNRVSHYRSEEHRSLLSRMTTIFQLEEVGLTTVGIVFLWAGIAKLLSGNDFKMTVSSIPHLPVVFIVAIPLATPPLEIAIALGLMLGFDVAKLAAIALLLFFSLLALLVMRAKLKVACNCFGSGDRVFSWWTVAQNIGLVALIVAGFPVKHAEDISLNVSCGATALVVVLSVATIRSNWATIKELRHWNAI
jgi:hypothetical protein